MSGKDNLIAKLLSDTPASDVGIHRSEHDPLNEKDREVIERTSPTSSRLTSYPTSRRPDGPPWSTGKV